MKSRTPAMPNSAVSSSACIAASFPGRSSSPIAVQQRHHEIRRIEERKTALGQSETNVTTEPWSAVEWIADADLTRASFYWDSVPHCRNPPRACQIRGRAIPCSDCAKQRHDIIPNRLALTAEESVSGVTGATAQVNQETPPMRIYIIGKDGITLCREPPATVNKGDVAVASREELHAARLSGKRLLALWNALPGVEKQTKVGDRDTLIDQLWSAIEALPDPDQPSDTKRPSKQEAVIAMLQRPEGATVDEVASVMGWQRHTVRGLFSGTLKKKLGLTLGSATEERGRVYRIAAPEPA